MGFKLWEVKGKHIQREYDMVRISDRQIYISKEAVEKCFKGGSRISLYWDEERRVVGMAANGTGFKLTEIKNRGKSTGVLAIRWARFTTYYKIHFDKATNRKIVPEGNLWTFKP